jgi:choline dehydrogenase
VQDYDVVIVGAGAAGCVLANRLSADPNRRVLLLEAGGPDMPLNARIPAAWLSLLNTEVDWGYHTVPQRHCFGRRMFWPRGKLLGGSGSINAMIYMRGAPVDYDRWRDSGCLGWGWSEVLPVFRRSENNARLAADPRHGDAGELLVADVPEHDPAEHLWVQAAQQAGLPYNDDFNGETQYGCGFFQTMIANGERHGPATAFLAPAMSRPNLTLATHALATRIVIENGRARGVEYLRLGRQETAWASAEIVLSAGAVNTPHLLLLSGVGAPEALSASGVTPVHELPGVGRALQDHVNCLVTYASDEKFGIGGMSVAELEAATAEWLDRRTGPMANPWSSTGGHAKSRPELAEPDLQLYGVASANRDHGRYLSSRAGMSMYSILQRPRSSGRLTLRSADPLTPPAIDPDYFSDPEGEDLRTLVAGIRLGRRIAEMPALAPLHLQEITPSAEARTNAEIAAYVRAHLASVYHPASSCRMGTDADAVVQPEDLKVRGLEGLRIADASVFPSMVAGNIYATVVMVAERAAAFIDGSLAAP